jgi:hypothetical protein
MDEQRQRRAIEEELVSEVAPGHPLAGRSALAIARCQRCDDVLFGLDSGRHAVHAGRRQPDPSDAPRLIPPGGVSNDCLTRRARGVWVLCQMRLTQPRPLAE